MRSLSVVLSVVVGVGLSACVTEDEDLPPPTAEEIQAEILKNSEEFLAANTVDGVFHVPRPPSVENETSYSGCNHTWVSPWYMNVGGYSVLAGSQWHVSRCDGTTGEYCTWVQVILESAFLPTGDNGTSTICMPTACSCVYEPSDDDGGGGVCDCNGYCGGSCCT